MIESRFDVEVADFHLTSDRNIPIISKGCCPFFCSLVILVSGHISTLDKFALMQSRTGPGYSTSLLPAIFLVYSHHDPVMLFYFRKVSIFVPFVGCLLVSLSVERERQRFSLSTISGHSIIRD